MFPVASDENDDWPLTEDKQNRIHKKRAFLQGLIDCTDSLCTHLFNNGSITEGQKAHISKSNWSTSKDKVDAFLDVLMRCSLKVYKDVLVQLDQCGQPEVAEFMMKDGGLYNFLFKLVVNY